MICIFKASIFDKDRTDYSSNGSCILSPNSCEYNTATRTLTLEHDIDEDGKYKYIQESAVIKAPNYNGKNQLFRIYERVQTETEVVAYARPIFYDAKEIYLFDKRIVEKNAQDALDYLLDGTIFSGESDIELVNTSYLVDMNMIEALLGDADNSFLNRWGGEVEFDNFKIKINKRNGTDKGKQIRYGENIKGLNVSINVEDVVKSIRPKSYNGYSLPENEVVSSPTFSANIGKTVVKKYQDIKLKDDLFDGEDITNITVCDSMGELYGELRKRAAKEFSEGISEPKITVSVDLATLKNSAEYQDFSDLEELSLGDNAIIKHPLFDSIEARVNSLVYDCILEEPSRLIIGNAEYNYITETVKKDSLIYKVIDKDNGIISDSYTTYDDNGNTVSGISGQANGIKYLEFNNGLITNYVEGILGSAQIIWGSDDPEISLADKDEGTLYVQV